MKNPQTEAVETPAVNIKGEPVSPPLVQSTAFAYPDGEELEAVFAGKKFGYVYTRLGNPTLNALEQKINKLERGIGAVSAASGMAAITGAILTLAHAGDEIVAASSLFGGTYELFSDILPDYGITTKFVDAGKPESFEAAIGAETRLLFVETIGNPRLDVADIKALAAVADRNNLPLVVDSTVTTPLLIRPGEQGAALVIHSTTKYLNGHGNAVGGAIVDCGNYEWGQNPHLRSSAQEHGEFAFIASLRRRLYRNFGFCLSPFNAYLTLTGIESLGARMKLHCSNAEKLADALKDQPRLVDLRFPGLKKHENYELAKKLFDFGFGAILTLHLSSKQECFSLIKKLSIPRNLANIGDTSTLIIHPASTICRDSSADEKENMGVTENMLRVCVGLEDADDLIADFKEGLNSL